MPDRSGLTRFINISESRYDSIPDSDKDTNTVYFIIGSQCNRLAIGSEEFGNTYPFGDFIAFGDGS